eukprot:CAMPEP_0168518008 /NCGR_PEP_ID=MMETSP0405-20121227/6443_1 /TAXON_ID=498012 /ORGANISM="Trichosphaerium sp, Strain Am-I-7 wt" /LENGTH=63 /DNA_ID=CAMNT_0008538231 /DNA_START=975 /DNA_END=1166 /DNA_ORIENTATION=+
MAVVALVAFALITSIVMVAGVFAHLNVLVKHAVTTAVVVYAVLVTLQMSAAKKAYVLAYRVAH